MTIHEPSIDKKQHASNNVLIRRVTLLSRDIADVYTVKTENASLLPR